MTSRPVWLNAIERDAWVEKNCRVCYQPDEALKRITGREPGCPHLERAENGKLPTPWTRRRNAVVGETYRCEAFINQPATNRRKTAAAPTDSLWDLEEAERNLVPVEGWPDWRAEQRKQKEGDHQ